MGFTVYNRNFGKCSPKTLSRHFKNFVTRTTSATWKCEGEISEMCSLVVVFEVVRARIWICDPFLEYYNLLVIAMRNAGKGQRYTLFVPSFPLPLPPLGLGCQNREAAEPATFRVKVRLRLRKMPKPIEVCFQRSGTIWSEMATESVSELTFFL